MKILTPKDPFFLIDYELVHLLGGEFDGEKIPVTRGVRSVTLPVPVGWDRIGYFHAARYKRAAETNIFVREQ